MTLPSDPSSGSNLLYDDNESSLPYLCIQQTTSAQWSENVHWDCLSTIELKCCDICHGLLSCMQVSVESSKSDSTTLSDFEYSQRQ